MSNDTQQLGSSTSKTIYSWIQLFLGIVAVLGVLWTIVQFFNPLHDVDMTVWIQQEIPVEPPSLVGSAPLEILYEGTPINRATVLQINISNTGSMPVGKNGGSDEIILRPDNNAKIALLSQPVTHPSNLEFGAPISSPLTNTLTLTVGLFNPRDFIELQLIIIDPQDINHPVITPEVRIPNLSQPTVTREAIEDRLIAAFQLPVFIFFMFLVICLIIIRRRDFMKIIRRGSVEGRISLIGLIIMVTAFLSNGLSKLIVWLIRNNQIR